MKPDWYGVKMLLLCKRLYICLKMHLSKALSMLLNNEMSLLFEGKEVSSFLGIGLT